MKKQMNYFGWKTNVKPVIRSRGSSVNKINFMPNVKRNSFSNTKMSNPLRIKQTNKYFVKEKLSSRTLKPYGDVDMDGSPNKFDCSPRQVNRDGVFARLTNIVSGGRVGQSRDVYSQERKDKISTQTNPVLYQTKMKIQKERKNTYKKITEPLTKPSTTPLKLAAAILPKGEIPKKAYAPSEKKESDIKYSRPGRPRGALSAGYYIPGKGAVDVREWRKWISKQRKLRRMIQPQQASEQYSQYKSYQEAYPQQVPQETEEYQEVQPDNLQIEQERVRQLQLQRLQQLQNLQPQSAETTLTREPGVRLSTSSSDNILNAPNIMRGEMTKVVSGINEKPIITTPQRPISNPHGQEFIDIDPASGKPMIRRRISEKWLTGEAR